MLGKHQLVKIFLEITQLDQTRVNSANWGKENGQGGGHRSTPQRSPHFPGCSKIFPGLCGMEMEVQDANEIT
jgi:hypothetical protein